MYRMKTITVADRTLVTDRAGEALTFREKTEIARLLDRMCTDVIEFAPIANEKTDPLLIRTVAPLLKNSILSQRTGYDEASVDLAWSAVSTAKNPRLSVAFPVAAAQMEFVCRMKPKAVLAAIPALVAKAKNYTKDVEFCAVDATRGEYDFLVSAIRAALEAGATTVTVSDTASLFTPDEIASFIEKLRQDIPALKDVRLGVECTDGLGMALASVVAAIRAGADEVKCAASGQGLPTEAALFSFLQSRGDSLGVASHLNGAEISRLTGQIQWIQNNKKTEISPIAPQRIPAEKAEDGYVLDKNATVQTVGDAVRRLGYDLSEEDSAKVYEAFTRIAAKKPVGTKELEVIVATAALQVPPTYKLLRYVVNNGNTIPSTAQISLEKDGRELSGVCIGDGPIDAAFLAIEQILGHHYELDEFRIQAITEGREAVGSALIRLRAGGKLYSGNGISTDITRASIAAYLNALNKIVYEEA